jgi:hypothetical protein
MESGRCPELRREMLDSPIDIEVDASGLDLERGMELARNMARTIMADPMLLAWYDGETGEYSPQGTCCREDRPAWLGYAQSRGADLTISMNRERFVFLFRGFEQIAQ